MEKFLQKLRKKPKAHRQAIALGISGIITAIIFFVWITTFIATVANAPDNSSAASINTSKSPFAVLQEGWDEMTTRMSEQFSSGLYSTSSLSTSSQNTTQSTNTEATATSTEVVQ